MKPAVVQLIDSFNQGGSERQALQLTRLLAESDRFRVRLASLSPKGSLRPSIDDLDLGAIPSFPLNSFYDVNAVKQLRHFVAWLRFGRDDSEVPEEFFAINGHMVECKGRSLLKSTERISHRSMRLNADQYVRN